jgi:hypothetical protein
MKFSYLIGKIAADKDSRKLGKIYAIDRLPKDDGQNSKLVEVLLIHVSRFFRKDIGVPISSEKILKVEKKYVWFDLTKEDFVNSYKDAKEISIHMKDTLKCEEKWKVKWSSYLKAREEQ